MWPGENKMSQSNAYPLVGNPMTGQRNYSAAGTRPVKLGKLKFKSRRRYCSIFVHGFILDEIANVGEIARDGNIPETWLGTELGNWDYKKNPNDDPPSDFWRTVVADRGPDGRNAPAFYPTACKVAITMACMVASSNRST
jgi:hypothetical protein